MAEGEAPAEGARAESAWQWSWWKALLGAAVLVIVFAGGLQQGLVHYPEILGGAPRAVARTLPLTILFGGTALVAGWSHLAEVESETVNKAYVLAGVSAFATYGVVNAAATDWGPCNFGDSTAGKILDSGIVGEYCKLGFSWIRLLTLYTPAYWFAGLLTGVLAAAGTYWILPHRARSAE